MWLHGDFKISIPSHVISLQVELWDETVWLQTKHTAMMILPDHRRGKDGGHDGSRTGSGRRIF